MAIRTKIIRNSQRFLEPGEQVQAVFGGATANPWLVLLGGLVFIIANNYRCVVATDRRILVLDAGKLTMGTPKPLIRVLPRSTRIGPASGPIWYRTDVLGEVLRIHIRFHQDIGDADALASTLGDESPQASPQAESADGATDKNMCRNRRGLTI